MTNASVAISVGNNTDFQIYDDKHLYLVHDPESSDPTYLDLGLATTVRFADLIGHLRRLSIYAVDV